MNIKINRDALLKPLANVTSIVERKHALPILSNILIRVKMVRYNSLQPIWKCKYL